MSHRLEVSVIAPAYNEEENIGPLLNEIAAAMESVDCSYEVLFVDDGSTDNTKSVLTALAKKFPQLRPIYHTNNYGQSAGLATGFQLARGRKIITLDADQQNDPADIPQLLEALTEDFDCVCGVRTRRHDNFVRRLSSKIANGFRNVITGDRVTDAGCTFRSIRHSALKEIPVFNGMHRFLPTILRMQGFRVREIPVNHRSRTRGYSKYGINNRLYRGIRDCFAIRWYRCRAIKCNRQLKD